MHPLLTFLEGMDSDALKNVISAKFPDAEPYIEPAFVTADILTQIMPGIPVTHAQALAIIFNDLAPAYGLNSAQVFPEYIAEAAHESALFLSLEEKLNYSAKRLVEVWPKRFPTLTAAQPYANNPQRLANKVYADRMGNGNEASGDGWRYRGSGALQMTGKDMFTAYAKYKKRTDVGILADEIRKDLRTAIDSSMWVFAVNKKLLDEAEADQFDAITKAINGGNIGDAARKGFYKRALEAMPSK